MFVCRLWKKHGRLKKSDAAMPFIPPAGKTAAALNLISCEFHSRPRRAGGLPPGSAELRPADKRGTQERSFSQ